MTHVSSTKKIDDYPHSPENKADWRESYYFNFVDVESKVSGFTTIGLLPKLKRGEFIMALFYDDKQAVYYREHALSNDQSASLLSDEILTYKLDEPMRKWEINASNESFNVHISWKARFPPFDFGKGSGTSWQGHFEQSGLVNGEAVIPDGRKIRINGYSQRDKSWGARDWHIEKWFALHAQFQTRAVGLRKDTLNGSSYVTGGLSTATKQATASQIDLEMICGKDELKTPTGASTTIRYTNGNSETIVSRLISPKSFLRFSRSSAKGTTELFEGMALHECAETGEKGTGLIEFLSTNQKP
jgi:hypothetical protein